LSVAIFFVTLVSVLDSFRFSNSERAMPQSFGPLLHSSLEQGVLVLTIVQPRIQGEEIAQSLRAEMLAEVARTGANRVVIDLRNARYLSSVAFWPLLSLRRQLLDAGGRLLICGLSGDIEDVFMTTKMISPGGEVDAPFEVAPDAAAAVARLLEAAPQA
jgi:anti-anti-sigma factor